ncbi:MAG: zinc-ribbon domain-containing protein [Desulfotignum sp.]|nr:zinc-ribbon domain-containing protein [Desulfotignum sp.]MCF8088952.1 zinc-ribbon domain-containing protein [Desulfotignum sp.]
MIITCEKCETRFNLDESLLDADGSTVRCSRCQHIFTAFPPPAKPEFDDAEFQDIDFDKDLEFDDSDFDEQENLSEKTLDDEKRTQEVIQETVEPDELELEALDPDEIEIEFEDAETVETDEPDQSDELKLSDEPDLPEDMAEVQEELELGDITSEDNEPEFDLAFDLDEENPDTDELSLDTPEEKEPELEDQSPSHSLEETDPLDKKTKLDTDQDIDADLKDDFEPEETAFDGLDEFDDPDFNETDREDTDLPDTLSHETPPPRRPARASLIHPSDPEDERMDSEEPPAKRSTGLGLPVLVLLLVFLLAGGGYIAAAFLGYKIPFLPEIQIPFIERYLPEKAPETVTYPDPVPDQKSVTGRFLTNDFAGELFIITGKIENPAQIPYGHIQVKGTLFQKEKKAAMTQTVFCGNIIPEETLKTARIEDLTAQLKIPGGTADINEKIMPGDTVPFMLVFADLPRNLENFTVEVAGFDKATP